MAYDEELAQRIHDALDGGPGVTSKKMFGGLGFMVDGRLLVAADALADDDRLRLWVDRGVAFVRTLPPK
jgi:TfoX/Sxy family transcriptional regulator of competence genes